mmetsp:Transcript_29956/g.79889  ORF Transcript_29956/g.79889 Transcript_29956/m.79889 type:complete len:184 (-) Transcript_29956:100-651(-)
MEWMCLARAPKETTDPQGSSLLQPCWRRFSGQEQFQQSEAASLKGSRRHSWADPVRPAILAELRDTAPNLKVPKKIDGSLKKGGEHELLEQGQVVEDCGVSEARALYDVRICNPLSARDENGVKLHVRRLEAQIAMLGVRGSPRAPLSSRRVVDSSGSECSTVGCCSSSGGGCSSSVGSRGSA